ncbi:MAG TPA: SIMPL domain-containing protein [Candidatus Excrementavichristensenella intestinipullorum]|nr:SIMPL domain-containing protein [Candidatus Excrementavichristensenella intestinipullorum]
MKKLGIMLFVAVLTLGFCTAALADTDISATGTGQVSLTPDTASVYLGVSATNADAGQALIQVNEALSQVRQALSQAGVDPSDVSTSSIDMYTQIDYSSDEERISGYVVSHRLTVVVRDTNQLGAVIDSAVSAGANQISGISLSASNSEEAYNQALAIAVQNAQAHAQSIAQAAGMSITQLKELNESDTYGYNYGGVENYAVADGSSSTLVDIGTLTVSATVSAVFEAQ